MRDTRQTLTCGYGYQRTGPGHPALIYGSVDPGAAGALSANMYRLCGGRAGPSAPQLFYGRVRAGMGCTLSLMNRITVSVA